VLEQKSKVLEVKETELQGAEAELQCKEVELQREKATVTTLAITLTKKDVALEAREVAVQEADTALKEKEASLSVSQEWADAAQAEREEAHGCIKGEYMRFLLKLILGLPRLIFVSLFRAKKGGGGRDCGEGSHPGRAHSDAG